MASAKAGRATILHPTAFTGGGEAAFTHALRIALETGHALSLLRVKEPGDAVPHISGLRPVAGVLARWKMLGAKAEESAIETSLGMRVSAVTVPAANARTGILDYLDAHPCDLAVIATFAQKGLAHFLDATVEQSALRRADSMILFLRDGGRGFVDRKTGEIKLRKVLVPIDDGINFFPSVYRMDALIRSISPRAELYFLHAGARAPTIIDEKGDFQGEAIHLREGPAVEGILETARRLGADLIAMPTGGRHGLIGALRGSVTARILDDGRWPLLAAPLR
jgi:nucleotide-binding universal stress UspA family protein